MAIAFWAMPEARSSLTKVAQFVSMLAQNIASAMPESIAKDIHSSDSLAAMQNELGERLRRARVAAGLSQQELAAKSGVRQETISNIERGRNKGSKFIARIARALGVEAYELDTGRQDLSPIATASDAGNVSPGPRVRGAVPLISWVQAGSWRGVLENLEGEIVEQIDTTAPINRFTYALRVQGDSMVSPSGPDSFPEGTIIIIEPELEARTGDFVVVRHPGAGDTETTFKRLVRDGDRFFLQPLNPRYPMMELPKGAAICGVLREAVKRYR